MMIDWESLKENLASMCINRFVSAEGEEETIPVEQAIEIELEPIKTEIERLEFENCKLENECGHLQADLNEATKPVGLAEENASHRPSTDK